MPDPEPTEPIDDREQVLHVIREETSAFLRKDFDAWSGFWHQSEEIIAQAAAPVIGTKVLRGWQVMATQIAEGMQRYPDPNPAVDQVRMDNLQIVIVGDVAWASYDESSPMTGDAFDLRPCHVFKVLRRLDGGWKLAAMSNAFMTTAQIERPMIMVGSDAGIHWMNDAARAALPDHPGLVAARGRLGTRLSDSRKSLHAAISWAHTRSTDFNLGEMMSTAPPVRPVLLGEDETGAVCFCWVKMQDQGVFVTFDDDAMVARQVEAARTLFGLSTAQGELVQRILSGDTLSAAAETLQVSINTVRTQLQRTYDKIGVRSQSALVAKVLGAAARRS